MLAVLQMKESSYAEALRELTLGSKASRIRKDVLGVLVLKRCDKCCMHDN